MVRILFVGNPNNLPFAIAVESFKLGHYVEMITIDTYHLSDPYQFQSELPGIEVTHIYNLSDEDFMSDDPAINPLLLKLLSIQAAFDFVFLSDVSVAFGVKLSIPYGIIVTGNEISYYGSNDFSNMRSLNWPRHTDFSPRSIRLRRSYRQITRLVHLSFQNAKVIRTLPLGYWREADDFFTSLQIDWTKIFDELFFFTFPRGSAQISRHDVTYFLSGTRICIDGSSRADLSRLDVKGTDILIRGFAKYRELGGNGILGLFEKGPDIDRAKKLIESLGIQANVIWNQEVPLQDFCDLIAQADVIFDQLSESSVPGLVTGIAYAHGKPVIANFRHEIDGIYRTLPGINATTIEEVSRSMMFAESNPNVMLTIGLEGKEILADRFAIENYVKNLLDKIRGSI